MAKRKEQPKVLFKLRQFDIKSIRKDATVVFVGKRRSGKSYTLRELLYHQRDLPLGVVISGTEEASPFFSDFIPSSYIYSEFSEAIPEKLLKTQKKKKMKAREMGVDQTKDKCFLILDDCLYDKTWAQTKVIRELFMNGRHYNIFFVITMQYPLGIPPTLRSNIDYSFIFQDYNTENREKIYKSFAGAFGNKEAFNATMDSLGDFECIVIDNTVRTPKITDRVFYYKAPERNGNFRVGCDAYWRNHEVLYQKALREKQDESDEEDDGQQILPGGNMDITEYQRSKGRKGVNIRIKKY